MSTSLIDRITIDSQICHGKPSIHGMRYPVEIILDLLAAGMTHQEILADYPALEEDDIKACLSYASRLAKVKSVYKVGANEHRNNCTRIIFLITKIK